MKASNKAVFLYDFMQVQGGAESLTLKACEAFSELDLIVAWINERNFFELSVPSHRVRALSSHTDLVGWQTIKCANVFLRKKLNLQRYRVSIFSGNNAPLAILKSKSAKNIYYCHTPPRFVYDLKDYYLDMVPLWQKPALLTLIKWYKPLYEASIEKMDIVLCNSVNIQRRLKLYLGIDSKVVYPPIETGNFNYEPHEGYFLSTARLEPYKRVDNIIKAFKNLPEKKLVVASGGSQLNALQNMARDCPNIKFTGWLPEEKLLALINRCLATIYIPINEDLGMSPIESMAAGKPVIGAAEGGLIETVLDRKTGWLLNKNPGAKELEYLIRKVTEKEIVTMREQCEKQSKLFSSELFIKNMRRYIVS